MTLIEYCTGLILVCTVLLVVATSVTIKNYWMIRDLTSPPDRLDVREPRTERYDSGLPAESDWAAAPDPNLSRH